MLGRKFGGQCIKHTRQNALVTNKTKSYSGGSILIDAATGFINAQLQRSIKSEETIQAVKGFEQNTKDHGIFVKEYQTTDDGLLLT